MDDVFDNFGIHWDPRSLVPVVKIVSRRDCWVSLPANYSKELHRNGVQLPAVLQLTSLDEPGGKERYICWDGGSCVNGHVEVPHDVAHLIGIQGGSRIRLEICNDIPNASWAQVTLQRQDDWEVLSLEQTTIEQTIRNQVGAVFTGQSFPIYLRSQAPFVLTPVEVSPAPIARLTGSTELEVVPPSAQSLTIQTNSHAKLDEVTSPSDIRDYSVDESLCWLRLQQVDAKESMGCVEMTMEETSPERAAVSSMLSTGCCMCALTADSLGVSEGGGVAVIPWSVQEDSVSDRVECVALRVIISPVVAIGHVMVSKCVRQCLEVEEFEYVQVMRCHLPPGLRQDVQIRLHPVSWHKKSVVSEEEQRTAVTGDSKNGSLRKIEGSRNDHVFYDELKPVLTGFFSAWLSSQLITASRISVNEVGWDGVVLHTGSIVHMTVNDTNGSWKTETSTKEFAYVLELCSSSDEGSTVMEGPCVVTQAQLTKLLISDRVKIMLDHAYSIDSREDASFPLALEPLACPPWLQSCLQCAVSHLAPTLDPDLNINLGNSQHPPVFPTGVLVSGSKGSGKTNFASGVARVMREDSHIQAMIGYVSFRDLVGETSASGDKGARSFLLRELQKCIRKAPALMIFDDLEALIPRENSEDQLLNPGTTSNLASWLLELIEDVNSAGHPVTFLATCESLEAIADELRCDAQLFHVELPAHSPSSRTEVLIQSLRERGASLTKMPVQDISDWGTGYEAGDLVTLADRAIRQRVLEEMAGLPCECSSSSPLVIGNLDVANAREGFKPAALWGASNTRGIPGIDGWEDVGGLHSVREVLHEAVELPIRCSGILSLCPLRLRTGVLLFGPTGCGKTYVISAAVQALGVRLISVKGPELLNKYIGASEAGVRDIFKRAASCAPCVLFFDEFEALAPARGHDSTGVSDRVVNQLLTEMDGVEGLEGVSIIAASSRPDLIDPALLRPGRLDRWVYCPMPNETDRCEILHALSRRVTLSEDVDLEALADRTEGFSGADLRAVLAAAHLHAIQAHLEESPAEKSSLRINAQDFEAALQSTRPSIPPNNAAALDEMYRKFIRDESGSQGNHSVENVGKRVMLA